MDDEEDKEAIQERGNGDGECVGEDDDEEYNVEDYDYYHWHEFV